MSRRLLPLVLGLLLAPAGCGGHEQRAAGARPAATTPATDAPSGSREHPEQTTAAQQRCPVTAPNHDIPPGQADNPGAATAPYLGDGRLWTVLPTHGVIREAPRRDGSIREKFPWWRAVRGRLELTGHELAQNGPALRAVIPSGYGLTGFQASGIHFPRAGCWRVTATAGPARLTFVTLVKRARRS